MPSVFLLFFAFTAVFLGISYQIYISPFLELAGVFRNVEPLNTEHCETVAGLQACEKLIIHSSGLVYLACASSLQSRLDWMPALDVFNVTALQKRTSKDYIATYDPQSRAVTKLDILGFSDPRGLNVHGMDVVPDEKNPDTLWVYAVNHRPPIDLTVDAARVGADSVIEIFKTRLGQSTMEWMKTVSDPTIITPNDVVGSANGQEFWFTNDNHAKIGLMRKVYALLRVKKSSVGYCHVEDGCKIAADNLYGSNGIVRAGDGTIWVASTGGGYITVLEQQSDKSLTPTEVINIERPIDNLALSPDGSIIAATSPKVIHFISKGTKDPSVYSPLSAHRISVNTGRDSYFGIKYRVEKIFEEDGSMMGSLATSAAVYQDSLYLHGVLASRLLVCRLPSRTLNQE